MRLPACTSGRTGSSVTSQTSSPFRTTLRSPLSRPYSQNCFKQKLQMAARRRPENLTAYDCYLRAMPQYYLATREGLAEVIRLAHRALELDPRFGSVAV